MCICGMSLPIHVRKASSATTMHRTAGCAGFISVPYKEWKHWWAVTEADRLRLRVEIDALCADLYGLEPDDFDWIVRDDPTDPKGFYRVDRQLRFSERLTGLAAVAFRALKEKQVVAGICLIPLQRRVLRPPWYP